MMMIILILTATPIIVILLLLAIIIIVADVADNKSIIMTQFTKDFYLQINHKGLQKHAYFILGLWYRKEFVLFFNWLD